MVRGSPAAHSDGAEGDPSGVWVVSVFADVLYPSCSSTASAVASIDAGRPRDYLSSGDRDYANVG